MSMIQTIEAKSPWWERFREFHFTIQLGRKDVEKQRTKQKQKNRKVGMNKWGS